MPIGSVYAASLPVSNVTASTSSVTRATPQPQPLQEEQQRQQVQQASDQAANQRVSGDPETSSALSQPQETPASALANTEPSGSERTESSNRPDESDVTDSRRAAGAAPNEANVAAQPRIDVFV